MGCCFKSVSKSQQDNRKQYNQQTQKNMKTNQSNQFQIISHQVQINFNRIKIQNKNSMIKKNLIHHKDFELQTIQEKSLQKKKSTKFGYVQKFDCPVCFIDFDLTIHLPMMICLRQHNICKICLQTYEMYKQDFPCPLCNQLCKRKMILINRMLQIFLKQEQFDQKQQLQKVQALSQIKKIQLHQPTKSIYILDEEKRKSEMIQKSKIMSKIQQYRKSYIQGNKQLNIDNQLQKTYKNAKSYQKFIVKSQIRDLVLKAQIKSQISFEQEHFKLQVIPTAKLNQNLQIVNLDYNSIKRIIGLNHLKVLKYLSLNHNLIEKIENLDGVQKLKFLSLSKNVIIIEANNKIEQIENLQGLQFLLQVYLQYNKINKKKTANRKAIFNLKQKQILVQL